MERKKQTGMDLHPNDKERKKYHLVRVLSPCGGYHAHIGELCFTGVLASIFMEKKVASLKFLHQDNMLFKIQNCVFQVGKKSCPDHNY